jgi:3-oxoacyl-[acyl-carrier protein] reductase
MSLDHHVALVTGGGQGLGRAIVETLAAAGAAVAVLDFDGGNAEAAVRAIQASFGCRACAVTADVAVKAQVAAAVEQAASALGAIDLLINNAGIWRHDILLDVPEAEWNRVLAVNLNGALFCSQCVAPSMLERGAGKIVHIASAAGLGPGVGWAAYQVSKAALIMLGRIQAEEFRDKNIQVNVVCPGAIRTPMLETIQTVEGGDYVHAADPAAIAQVILRLVDPFEQTTTGQVVDREGNSVYPEGAA